MDALDWVDILHHINRVRREFSAGMLKSALIQLPEEIMIEAELKKSFNTVLKEYTPTGKFKGYRVSIDK
jgi:hypothetical protein